MNPLAVPCATNIDGVCHNTVYTYDKQDTQHWRFCDDCYERMTEDGSTQDLADVGQ